MKVAFFADDAELYGAARSLVALIEGLRKLEVTCFLFIPYEGPLVSLLKEKNIEYEYVYYRNWVDYKRKRSFIQKYYFLKEKLIKVNFNYRALSKIKKKLQQWNVDTIYSNGSLINIGAIAARLLKTKHVWHIREFRDVDYNLYFDWGTLPFNFLLKRSAAVIFNSITLKLYHQENIDNDKCYVVYNGILFEKEFEKLRSIYQNKKRSTPYTFAIVGTLNPNKGQHLALEAFFKVKENFPDIRLIMAGRKEEKYFASLKDKYPLEDGVEYWGHIYDAYRIYEVADVILMCSSNEAWGRVTVEAMSACLPVIGFNSSGTKEIIKDGITGMLFDGTPENLTECMQKCLGNKEWAAQLGQNGWKEAKENYTIERYSKDVYTILETIH